MKLIATLATLAALVGQTEAAASATAATVVSVKVGNAPCTDEILLKATASTAVAATKKMSFSSSKLSTKKTATTDLQVLTDASTTSCHVTSGSANANAAAIFTVVTATESSGVTTWEWTAVAGSAGCNGGDIKVTLKNVCNNGLTDYNGKGHDLKYTADADTVFPSTQTTTVDQIASPPVALADFVVTKMPLVKATTDEFEATFTGATGLQGKSLVLNLPKDYTIPAGAKCSIKKKADATAKIITAASDGGLGSECSDTCLFSVALPSAAGVGYLDATEATFYCDKVKSGAELPDNAVDAVAIKLHGTSNANDYAGYSKFLTPSPTKSPTKAADSPASVATASGVVVGALGVAALFLA